MSTIADRRVKIVATIGPSTSSKEDLKKLILSGMNIARLNFSHGTHEEHESVIKSIRELSRELGAPVGILQDLQGPKIRVGKMKGGSLELKQGAKVTISTAVALGENNLIPTEYLPLPKEARSGMKILLDDGLIELKVLKTDGVERVDCEVVYGGQLSDRKGMNIPGANLSVDCLTSKDLKDLEFGLKNKVDYVALSFVRSGDDIRKLRTLIDETFPTARIVSKIEMLEAVENLAEIVGLSDAVMVARGDLAVEVGASHLPALQKEIISLCNELARPVITATQMLESMVKNISPTRAEVMDVANAVLDGTDALMLSAETASGKYPFKCVSTMAEIASEVERGSKIFYKMNLGGEFLTVSESIAASACLTAKKLNASAIVCLTTTGTTATLISRYRPKAKIIAATHILSTLNRLELTWGIQTIVIDPYDNTEAAMEQIERILVEYGLVRPGEKMVLTMGMPVAEKAKTNTIRVYDVKGEGLNRLSEDALPYRLRSFQNS